jgi:histidyl-tRNA synthetase
VDETAIVELAALGSALADSSQLVFDPFLVRGMGYYTGTIFEVAHPDLGYSLGGGGRYDGMIGRFLGTDVPAAGISLGFERLVDLVTTSSESSTDAVALVYESVEPSLLANLKSTLIAQGLRVRLEKKPKKLPGLLDTLAASGFGRFAVVTPTTATVDDLDFRPLTK